MSTDYYTAIREKLQRDGLSQEALARLIDASIATVRGWVGHNPEKRHQPQGLYRRAVDAWLRGDLG